MTQPPPPPPPHQPPQGGGFGPPQDPPPGGFGAPVPPPPQGYGPPPQMPYGYGHPTPVPGPGKKLGIQARIIIAAAVAVVLIVGSGVWFAASRGDGGTRDGTGSSASGGKERKGEQEGKKGGGAPDGPGTEKVPADTASRTAFAHPEPKVEDITFIKGSWISGKTFVKPGINSVVGFDADSGATAWTLKLPGQVCASSAHQSEDGKAAIVFEAAKRTAPRFFQPCTEVGVVDLGSGKLLWRASVTGARSGDAKVKFAEITQSGTTVAAGGLEGGAAFDLGSGKVLWKPGADAGECYDRGYGGGPALVAVRRCGPVGSSRTVIQALNPKDGAPLFSYRMPETVEYANVVSSSPLVVAADVGDTAGVSGFSDLFSLDGKGALRARIPATGDAYEARCRATEVESCKKMAVGNGRVYLPTAARESSSGFADTNEIVSFDLATGKPTSDRADAGARHLLMPVRMDGGNLIAYRTPAPDSGGQVVSIDGATFEQTVLMKNSDERSSRDQEIGFTLDSDEIDFENGRLFLSGSLMSRTTVSDQHLVVGFRTG
ncbi:outer membrane protein assembly factor BamB family protein [Streptomyces sp. NPDC001985]|uniref:outer membrane protein assembly factor BamB family protein n=1 Tax=Streptomyces sp. NPDC001985 TaxID=3154406 RepID=UPI0033261FA4